MSASSGQQTGIGGGTGIGGAGQTGGAGGAGQPGTGTQYQTFAISCRNSIIVLNFVKWQINDCQIFIFNGNLVILILLSFQQFYAPPITWY